MDPRLHVPDSCSMRPGRLFRAALRFKAQNAQSQRGDRAKRGCALARFAPSMIVVARDASGRSSAARSSAAVDGHPYPHPYRTAVACSNSSPWGVTTCPCGTRPSDPRPGGSRKIPLPSLLISTIVKASPGAAARRAGRRCRARARRRRSAARPDPRPAAATPNAEETVPSILLAPWLDEHARAVVADSA